MSLKGPSSLVLTLHKRQVTKQAFFYMLGKNFLKQFSHHSVAMYISYTPKYVHNWQPCVAWLDYYNFLTVSSFEFWHKSKSFLINLYCIVHRGLELNLIFGLVFTKKDFHFPHVGVTRPPTNQIFLRYCQYQEKITNQKTMNQV